MKNGIKYVNLKYAHNTDIVIWFVINMPPLPPSPSLLQKI